MPCRSASSRTPIGGLIAAALLAGCVHAQAGASPAATSTAQSISRLATSHGEHVLLIEGRNRVEYLVRLEAGGAVSYRPGVVGRLANGGTGVAGFEIAVSDRPPDAWASRGSAVDATGPAALVDRLVREIDALAGVPDVGQPCAHECATCPKPHYLPQARPSEPPVVIAIWDDHFSRPIGCDPRGRDVQRDALSLAEDLDL